MWIPAPLLTLSSLLPAAPQDSEALLAHFEGRVRPLLVQHCLECHDGPRPKGGLSLASRAGWERGGDSGPALVPGDPARSLLVRAVRYEDSDLRMPPTGRLDDAELATLIEWVRLGAPDPREAEAEPELRGGIDLEAGRGHWAFRPLADPAPPAVRDEAWVRGPLDRFVLARLEGEGLTPAAPAPRRAWLRRVSFDLIGLPPSEDELAAFLADQEPGAHERVVERLLASPHYGERWARRWLDVARYADSNGLDENLALAHAWRYRDYVVRAFNQDKPYDRFVVEQLAGDLLPPSADELETFEAWTATGFLVLGPKMLAEQDKEKLVLDVVDEQLDVAGQAFLGMTFGCARCHDHKFDPVSHADYHALAGIFRSTSTLASLEHVSRWQERELAGAEALAARERWEARAAELEARLASLESEARAEAVAGWRAEAGRYLVAASRSAAGALVVQAEDFSRSNLNVDRSTYGDERTTVVHTARAGLQFAEYDLAVPGGGPYRLEVRYAAQEPRPMRLLLDGALVRADVLAETTGGWRADAQAWHAVAELELRPGRNVLRLEREVSVPHLDVLLLTPRDPDPGSEDPGAQPLSPAVLRGWILAWAAAPHDDALLGLARDLARVSDEAFALEAGRRVADLRGRLAEGSAPASLTVLDDPAPPASRRELAERYQALFDLAAQEGGEGTADPLLARARELLRADPGPLAPSPRELDAALSPAARARSAAARAELEAHGTSRPAPFERVLAVREGEVADLRLHARGSHLALVGDPIPRGVPAVFAGLAPAPAMPADQSGRLELARWIAHPEHPLTARVAANRAWQAFFGAGLVASSSNFGLRGEEPSHPELLDWLARELVRQGWSLKELHRTIALSATYRQGSGRPDAALERDPANRLLAGWPRRRLEAEELRDALLEVGGTLDRTLGGSLLETPNAGYVTNDQSNDAARYASRRRSLYLPIVRNSIYDLFAAFDYADPSVPIERRSQTTVAHQVLALLNSPLALEASAAFAARLLAAPELDEAGRIGRAYLVAFGRPPHATEILRAREWLARARGLVGTEAPGASHGEEPPSRAGGRARAEDGSGAPPEAEHLAWQALCQVLLASNEFLYLD